MSARLAAPAAAALAWLEEHGMTTTGAVNTALIDLAQSRGMGAPDIETRVAAIEATVDELRQAHRMTRGG